VEFANLSSAKHRNKLNAKTCRKKRLLRDVKNIYRFASKPKYSKIFFNQYFFLPSRTTKICKRSSWRAFADLGKKGIKIRFKLSKKGAHDNA